MNFDITSIYTNALKNIYCMGEVVTLIITIKWLHHYENIIMIPVQFRVDVDIKRTRQN
jgi:hypothetical protein